MRLVRVALTLELLPILLQRRHGELPFPEGTACAMVLIAGDRGGASARPVFGGIAAGALYTLLGRGLRLWGDTVFWTIGALHKASIGFELSPMFLGVGYLIGPRIASVMLAGGLLGWAVLIPFFDLLGERASWFGVAPGVGALEAKEIWRQAVRYPNVWTQPVAVAATTRTGRVFLGFSRFPAARSFVDPTGVATVRWNDMRFAGGIYSLNDRRPDPFAVVIRIGPEGHILSETLGR